MNLPPTPTIAAQDPATYVAILLGGFVLLYMSVLRPMMKGKKKDPLEQPPLRIGLAQQRAIERDMQNLLVEYEKMIRNMTAGLDTRAAKLELLLKEADDKLAALRAAGAAGGDNGGSVAQAAAPAVADVVGEPRSLETREVQPSGPDPRHAEVYALADQGLSAREVARRLGRPNGEIELILALRAGSR